MTTTDENTSSLNAKPQLTIEGIYNLLALLFFGTAFAIFGLLFSILDLSLPVIGKVGFPLLAIFVIIYYLLFLDFLAYYLIKAFGIVSSHYKKYKIWYFFFAMIVLVIALGTVAKYYSTGNTFLEVFIDVTLLVILAIIIEIIRPILSPKIDIFLKKFQEK